MAFGTLVGYLMLVRPLPGWPTLMCCRPACGSMSALVDAFGLPDAASVLSQVSNGAMWFRFLFGGGVLLYAIWLDLKYRRVPNWVWLATAAVGLVFIAVDIAAGSPAWVWFAWIPVVIVVTYALWWFRLLFGGADAKCVMAFAILVPYPPALMAGDGGLWPHLPAFMPTAATMLFNAVLFTLVIPISYAVMNAARGNLHPAAMFLGRRVPLASVYDDPVWVMDWVDVAPENEPEEEEPSLDEMEDDPVLDRDQLPALAENELDGATIRLHYMPTRAGDYVRNLARLEAMGVTEVWVTPKVPFMVPLMLGYVGAFVIGDVLVSLTLWLGGAF